MLFLAIPSAVFQKNQQKGFEEKGGLLRRQVCYIDHTAYTYQIEIQLIKAQRICLKSPKKSFLKTHSHFER